MEIELKDKVGIVTGGSEGIGAEIARMMARCGARVGIVSRDLNEMAGVAQKIASMGGECICVKADVTSDEQVESAINRVCDKWGRLDLLVANAGINGTWAPIDELTPEEWQKTIDMNLGGTYRTIHFAVPKMRAAGGGSIVIISSINGTRTFSNEGASAYGCSKGGQLALGQMLALELSRSNIRINVVCPGAFTTGIHDKTERRNLDDISIPAEYPEGKVPITHGEMGDPEEVANLVTFLLSDTAKHITGSPVWIDGGQSLLL
ncbi:MAG: SDR family NAD(P)-dependent oxidoreductase [Verrucomicrobiales bacterium]|nr:SDR family NAD(P)-dependent oxidoreductase [Verrucomicrobiales bacterium]